jgi:hypothetical protein
MLDLPWRPIIVYIKGWLQIWGTLALTLMIAWAAIMQWIVGNRLYKLQHAVEDSHRRVKLFCRISPNLESPRMYARLQVSNLSGFAVWLEEIGHKFTLDGESEERSLTLRVQEVLESGKTYMTTVSGNIQSHLVFEENKAQGRGEDRITSLRPASFAVRVQVRYWANGSDGNTSTPQYHVRATEAGLQQLKEIGP